MFCQAFTDISFFIFTSGVPHLLYYTHIPVAILSLLLGIFVYSKSKKDLSGLVLFKIGRAHV